LPTLPFRLENRVSATLPLIEARNLRRRHPEGRGWLLDGVSVTLLPGMRVALDGPSGAGKTLLLRALAMLDPIEDGELFWRGKPVARAAVPVFRSRVIYLHQRPALLGETVEAAFRRPFRLKVHGASRYDESRIVAWLERLGRGAGLLRQPTAELSGGERQMVALLRAMQLDPAVLLLDEPAAALDAPTAESVECLVAEWFDAAPARRAFCWVSHDRRQAAHMTDRTLRLAAGRMAPPQEEPKNVP